MPSHARLNVRSATQASYRPSSPITFNMEHDDCYHRPSLPYTTEPDSYFNGVHSGGVRVSKITSQTYMYICCSCNDGPKVYNHQPQCINCGHKACTYCTQVK